MIFDKYYKKLSFFLFQTLDLILSNKIFKNLIFFIKRYKKLLIVCLIAFLISDLFLIKSYSLIIPDKELTPLKLSYQNEYTDMSRDSYKIIWETNIFHTGPIPSVLKAKVENLLPVLSSLAFTLKGTIIHANPNRSVAAIQLGSNNQTLSYQVGDQIEKQAEVRRIESAKVIFFNENNNRLEYIIIPADEVDIDISYKPKKKEHSLITKKDENKYQVSRSDINDHLKRLPEILNQARVVPHKVDGKIHGFRFDFIDKGSIFETLGFKEGDIIKEVDGEFVESPEQALLLFEKLKGRSGFKMLVEKDGRDRELEYNVRENVPIL